MIILYFWRVYKRIVEETISTWQFVMIYGYLSVRPYSANTRAEPAFTNSTPPRDIVCVLENSLKIFLRRIRSIPLAARCSSQQCLRAVRCRIARDCRKLRWILHDSVPSDRENGGGAEGGRNIRDRHTKTRYIYNLPRSWFSPHSFLLAQSLSISLSHSPQYTPLSTRPDRNEVIIFWPQHNAYAAGVDK